MNFKHLYARTNVLVPVSLRCLKVMWIWGVKVEGSVLHVSSSVFPEKSVETLVVRLKMLLGYRQNLWHGLKVTRVSGAEAKG